ncbi:hypothetical protein LCL87_18825 [Rhodococcus hoagii]|nr:hypothetical protein [Prescottella equi]
MIRIEKLSGDDAARSVVAALGLPAATPRSERDYELLRAVAWASTAGRVPVATRVLLDRAVEADAVATSGDIDEFTRRRILRNRLDDLAAIGDLANIGRGQWISVVGCLARIETGDNHRDMLVSGIPLRAIDHDLRAAIVIDGPTRTLSNSRAADRLGLPVVALADWARVPRLHLDRWTNSILNGTPVRPARPSTEEATHIYAADQSPRGISQDQRWITPGSRSTGRYLARDTMIGGWADYSIVDLQAGIVIDRRECDPQDVRRLMYGLDRKHCNPTTATWTASGDDAQLRLQNRLPYAETRALIVLAGAPRNDVWSITRHASEARRLLSGLGIEFID